MAGIEAKLLPVNNSNTSKRELVTNCVKSLDGHPGRKCYLDELNPSNIEYATILSAKKSGSRVFDSVLAI